MKTSLTEISKILLNTESPIYILIHKEPDGDAIGSAVALYKTLIAMGKDAFILNKDPIPHQFKFLISRVSFSENVENRGIFVFLDFSDMDKMQDLGIDLQRDAEEIVFIDHREPKVDDDKFLLYTDSLASSTAEIIYELIENMNMEYDILVAEAIYTGLISDTRSFKYTRTTPKSLRIAAELTEFGIDNEQIQRRVFSTASLDELKVFGFSLLNSKLSPSKKVAWTVLNKETMDKYGVKRANTKGFVNQLLSVNSVELAVLFREDKKDTVKVSIRAKGRYGLKYFVTKYNGKSTDFSASFVYEKPLNDEFVKEVIDRLDRLVSL